MAHVEDFEQKIDGSHPQTLRTLANTADMADTLMRELDDIVNGLHPDRVLTYSEYQAFCDANRPLMSLAIEAWKLRNAIRAEGERQLAEWEAAQADTPYREVVYDNVPGSYRVAIRDYSPLCEVEYCYQGGDTPLWRTVQTAQVDGVPMQFDTQAEAQAWIDDNYIPF